MELLYEATNEENMTNGILLEELRRVVATPGEISQDVATRLTLSALADLADKFTIHLCDEAERRMNDKLQDDSLGKMKQDLEIVKNAISNNPVVSIGSHLGRHPKMTWIYLTGAFVMANLWFISGFRKLVLLVLGVDPAIVNLLAP